MDRKAAAVRSWYPWPSELTRLATVTVKGATSGLPPRKISAIKRSFQTKRNWNIASDASTGTDRGRARGNNLARGVAPCERGRLEEVSRRGAEEVAQQVDRERQPVAGVRQPDPQEVAVE